MKDLTCTYRDYVRYVQMQRGDNLLPQAFVSERRLEEQRKGRVPAMSFGELQRAILRLEEWGIKPASVRSPMDLMAPAAEE